MSKFSVMKGEFGISGKGAYVGDDTLKGPYFFNKFHPFLWNYMVPYNRNEQYKVLFEEKNG